MLPPLRTVVPPTAAPSSSSGDVPCSIVAFPSAVSPLPSLAVLTASGKLRALAASDSMAPQFRSPTTSAYSRDEVAVVDGSPDGDKWTVTGRYGWR